MQAPSYLVLDIETVPDRQLQPPVEVPAGVEPPFPPLHACRTAVIGVMWLGEDLRLRRLGIVGAGKTEEEMLADFSAFMEGSRAQLVTWNGRGFDLPVLALRSLRYGLSWPWYHRDETYRRRYSDEGHLDLCNSLAGYGAARRTSLDGAARLIGLPGKAGMDGGQVEGLYNAGQVEAVIRYCLSDVVQTAFVMLRYRLLAGLLDRRSYISAAEAMLAGVAAEPRVAEVAAAADRRRLLLTD